MRILLLLAFCLAACVSEQKRASLSDAPSADAIRQGIAGKVLWLEGNLMPSVVEDTQTVNTNAGTPVSRTVYIYELTHQDQAAKVEEFYTDIDTKLVKKAETGEDGQFQVYLEPGKYSLFVKEPQGLYANLYDGEGHIQPVTVTKDSITRVTLKIDYKAVY